MSLKAMLASILGAFHLKSPVSVKAYKILFSDGQAPYSEFQWPLPKDGNPGDWVTTKGRLILCENGLHAVEAKDVAFWAEDIVAWLRNTSSADQLAIYEVELAGKILSGSNKLVASKARLLREIPKDQFGPLFGL